MATTTPAAGASAGRATRATAQAQHAAPLSGQLHKATAKADPAPLNPAIGKLQRVAFPPAHLEASLAPDDKADSLLMMICSALATVDNRALCPKEIAEMIMFWGWTTPGSQPFAVVSTCIRTHLKRRGLGANNVYKANGPPPLFGSWDLTTIIPLEDQLVMGIEPQAKPAVKRGTLWFLSKAGAGYESPFGTRHLDSLFFPPPPKKPAAAAAPRNPAAPKPPKPLPAVVAISQPLPASSSPAVTVSSQPAAPLLPALEQLKPGFELGRGKRKRKGSDGRAARRRSTSSTARTTALQAPAPIALDRPAVTSAPLAKPSQLPPVATSSAVRRLKVRLNAPTPCPVFSKPIDDTEDEDDETAVASDEEESKAHPNHLEQLDASGISAETLALERRRFRKRSRSESNMLLSTPMPIPVSSAPATAVSAYAPDYFAPAQAHGSASMPLSVSAPALDTWSALAEEDDMMEVQEDEATAVMDQTRSHSSDAFADLATAATTPETARPEAPSFAETLGLPQSEPLPTFGQQEPVDVQDSDGEPAREFEFDELDEGTSTAATTPRSPVQIKEEPLEIEALFTDAPRRQRSPMSDLPSLPIVTQAEDFEQQTLHPEIEDEAAFNPHLAYSVGTLNRLFAHHRHQQRSVSPDESLYTFAFPGQRSLSNSRAPSPGDNSFSDAAPSPMEFDEDELLGTDEQDYESDHEGMARESLSPVVDMSELDLGWCSVPSQKSPRLGAACSTPFGPEVFGLVGEAPTVDWQSPAQMFSVEAFNMTALASDDYLSLDDVDSVTNAALDEQSHSSSRESTSPHVEVDKIRTRTSGRRRSSLAADRLLSKTSSPSAARSTRSAATGTVKSAHQAAPKPAVNLDKPSRHTRSASNAAQTSSPAPAPQPAATAAPVARRTSTRTARR